MNIKTQELNEFSDCVLRKRKLEYSSARKFWLKNKESLKISYERYSHIEKGEPTTIKTALKLIGVLNLDESSALHAWMRSQLEDPKHKSYFSAPSETCDKFRNKLVITNEQRKVFEDCPFLYRVLIYLALFSQSEEISVKKISNTFKISISEATLLINKLQAMGILDLRHERLSFNGWCVIPEGNNFEKLRRKNFTSMVWHHFDKSYTDPFALEKISIRRVQPKNIQLLREKIQNLFRWWGSSDLDENESGSPFTFFVGGAHIHSFENDAIYWGFKK